MQKFDEHVILPPLGSVLHTNDNYFGDMMHAFCPHYSSPNSHDILRTCMLNIFKKARSLKKRTLIIPALDFELFGFSPKLQAEIMIKTCIEWAGLPNP
jgi:O-acetyl-ADP-ribose deacetylase (regulator of RNase III)